MPFLFVAVVVAVAVLSYRSLQGWRIRRYALERLVDVDASAMLPEDEPSAVEQWLARWLSKSGYRRSGAPGLFITLSAIGAGVGLVAGQFYRVALRAPLIDMVAGVPGGAGDVIAAILGVGHWILLVLLTLVPTLVVRAVRDMRVKAIEQDLPLVLELFATMAEAGLGFDAAITKVVKAQGVERPLIGELVLFQYDMLAGMPRSQALRQLARRVDVSSLSSFTSALVQAEEVGASLADTLRHQADDMRIRRREDALIKAQALPVKLVFPLVICFLPGIFLSTLAPVLYQMIQVAGGVLAGSGR
jgi:tight adherence protein C